MRHVTATPFAVREDEAARLPAFGEPAGAPSPERTLLAPEEHARRVVRDLTTDESVLEVVDDRGAWREEAIDLSTMSRGEERYRSVGNAFDSVRGETRWTRALWRAGWSVRTGTRTVMTANATTFRVRAELDAYETDEAAEHRVFCRSWDVRIPRDLVLRPTVLPRRAASPPVASAVPGGFAGPPRPGGPLSGADAGATVARSAPPLRACKARETVALWTGRRERSRGARLPEAGDARDEPLRRHPRDPRRRGAAPRLFEGPPGAA